MDNSAPPTDVLYAFGAAERPVRLAGGQGQTYRSGSVVLKPAQDDPETNWVAEFYSSVRGEGFRLPEPIRSSGGGFVYAGWQAWEFIPGQHVKGRWDEKIEVCIRFHRAIAHLPRPVYFDRREQNPWVVADQVVWGEREIAHHPRIAPVVEQLRGCLTPVHARPQLIHGDFGGNVLFSDELPPAVIDLSPYWRPVAFAVGVVVADAIVWEGAPESLIEMGRAFEDWEQYLARAELRRVIELETIHQMFGWPVLGEIEAHLPLVNMICESCGG